MSDKIEKLYNIHPWLKVATTLEDYIAPDYYDVLLKDYIFQGKEDFRHLIEFIKERVVSNPVVLELGCGTGRVAEEVLKSFKVARLDLVDLSPKMIRFSKEKFKKIKNIEFYQKDSLEYLEKTEEKYDLVYSLWSFSHSVYQHIEKSSPLIKVQERLNLVLGKTFKENLNGEGSFFLIHSDWLSEEQSVLIKQWARKDKPIAEVGVQGPSKIWIESGLKKLEHEGVIRSEIVHYIGEPIVYDSVEKALEVFINFHLESYFNLSEKIMDIIPDLEDYFKGFTSKDGEVSIRPGCFIFKATKLK